MNTKKPNKKSILKRLEKEADRLWSLAVRKRDKKCLLCGSSDNLQAHHAIVRRGSKSTRWILENGITLCVGCHIYKLHGRQQDGLFIDKYKAARDFLIPLHTQDTLRRNGHMIAKFSIDEMEETVADLKKMI